MTDLAIERQNRILAWLHAEGRVLVSELRDRLAVADETIRRDLKVLAERGAIRRVHGGALPLSPARASYSERARQNVELKDRLAAALVRRELRAGQVLFLDGGTTGEAVVRAIPPGMRLTVVTHSPAIALGLLERPAVEVQMPGGRLLHDAQVLSGAATTDHFRGINADLCVLGVCSLDVTQGITTGSAEEVSVKRTMVEQADTVVALLTSDKIGTVSPFRVSGTESLSRVITDHISSAQREGLTRQGVDVICLESGGSA
jgi:DeoR/GlpR family transcriptional regulator of sugar metabolism